MSDNFQNHVDKRIKEMNDRKRVFHVKKKCNVRSKN
jgi:hypothetical protein